MRATRWRQPGCAGTRRGMHRASARARAVLAAAIDRLDARMASASGQAASRAGGGPAVSVPAATSAWPGDPAASAARAPSMQREISSRRAPVPDGGRLSAAGASGGGAIAGAAIGGGAVAAGALSTTGGWLDPRAATGRRRPREQQNEADRLGRRRARTARRCGAPTGRLFRRGSQPPKATAARPAPAAPVTPAARGPRAERARSMRLPAQRRAGGSSARAADSEATLEIGRHLPARAAPESFMALPVPQLPCSRRSVSSMRPAASRNASRAKRRREATVPRAGRRAAPGDSSETMRTRRSRQSTEHLDQQARCRRATGSCRPGTERGAGDGPRSGTSIDSGRGLPGAGGGNGSAAAAWATLQRRADRTSCALLPDRDVGQALRGRRGTPPASRPRRCRATDPAAQQPPDRRRRSSWSLPVEADT